MKQRVLNLFQKLSTLNLPKKDFAVFGSGPLFIHGLREEIHDLDIIARNKAWEKAKKSDEVEKMTTGPHEVVSLFDGLIEIYNGWSPGEWDIGELIETAEIVGGIRYVTLENVFRWKKLANRPKDLPDIKNLERYFAQE